MIPKNKGKKIILSLVSVFSVIMVAFGVSYAMFYYQSKESTENYLSTAIANLSMDFTSNSNSIAITNAIPVSDSDGLSTTPYTFSITNDSDTNAIFYQVKLEEYKNSKSDHDDLTNYTFPDKALKVAVKKNAGSIDIDYLSSNYIVGESLLEVGGTDTYSVWLWLDYDAGNDAQNKHYHAYFKLDAFNYTEVNAPSLDDGMIPIKYDEAEKEWVKADVTNDNYDWYNYPAKRWANVALVKEVSTNNTNLSTTNIPDTYTELEYIESSGTQYIDTGFMPNQDTSVEIQYEITENNLADKTIFASGVAYSSRSFGIGHYQNGCFVYNASLMTNQGGNELNTKYTAKLDKNKFYLDSVQKGSVNYADFTSPNNLVLFAANYSSRTPNVGQFSYIKVFYTKIWDNGILIRNMVPAKRNSDNEIGMYDTVNNVFYTNLGTGDFIAGPSTCTGTNNYCTRSNYMNAPVDTVIPEEDILGYFVWIPRYKYKLFNVSTSSTVDPQEIDVIFESADATTGTGTLVGEYLTHPAFTFGEDNLTGIWVAKFETTGDGTTPTVKPNLKSLVNQNVSTQYQTALKFAGGTLIDGIVEFSGNTTYGLTQNIDSHMMKNTEWGAVAYLSHSKYGINDEIAINDSAYITGHSNGSNKIPTPGSAQGKYKYDDIYVYKETYSVTSNKSYVTPTIIQEETYPWTFQEGYYKSGNYAIAGTTSTMTVNFTLDEVGVLSFDYGVSSRSYSDYLYYTIDNGTTTAGSVALNGISGNFYGTTEENLKYFHQTISLEAGNYTVSFIYRKTSSRMGLDRGYVKNIKVEEGTVTTTNELIEGISGANSSTTGNIYGIYDMSGGAWEYVMGVMQDDNDPAQPRSGYTNRNYTAEESLASGLNSGTAYTGLNINSGFNGMLYGKDYDEETSTWVTMYKEDGVNFPNNKYYNLYGNTTTRILGDATRETAGWYGDYQNWVTTTGPWFLRGGSYSNGTGAGAFNFSYGSGHASDSRSFRVVLAR